MSLLSFIKTVKLLLRTLNRKYTYTIIEICEIETFEIILNINKMI